MCVWIYIYVVQILTLKSEWKFLAWCANKYNKKEWDSERYKVKEKNNYMFMQVSLRRALKEKTTCNDFVSMIKTSIFHFSPSSVLSRNYLEIILRENITSPIFTPIGSWICQVFMCLSLFIIILMDVDDEYSTSL